MSRADEILTVIADVLSPLSVSPEAELGQIGANSVLMLRLMVALQQRFNVTLSVVEIFTATFVEDLIKMVDERLGSTDAATQV